MFDTMGVKVVERYLDKFGWKVHEPGPEVGEKEGFVFTGWTDPFGNGHRLIIDPMVEKRALVFRAPILQVPLDSTPVDRVNGLLLAVGALNSQFILGAFAYNPNDGWLEFKLSVPSDNGGVEYPSFEHALKALTSTVDEMAPNLQAIADGTKTAREVLVSKGFQT
jgi:hypothetical protein